MMQKFENDWPVPTALCVFKGITGLVFLGYVMDAPTESGEWIKCYMRDDKLMPEAIESYQYVLNEQGGFCLVNAQNE